MKQHIESTLQKIVTNNNSTRSPIITGYNYYPDCISLIDKTVICFSHIHSENVYMDAVCKDLKLLGYPNQFVQLKIRDKLGYYQWLIEFAHRTNGVLRKNLHIINSESNIQLDLTKIPQDTLLEANFSQLDTYIANDVGYEINLLINNDEAALNILKLFLQKSQNTMYDERGYPIGETKSKKNERSPWPKAYNVPTLIASKLITIN